MVRSVPKEPPSPRQLFRDLALLAERRSELLVAEARIWADVRKLLTEAADIAPAPEAQGQVVATSAAGDAQGLLSVTQAADFLGLSRATLDKWRIQGGGPVFARIGGRIFYRRVTLEEFIASRTYPHTSAYDRKR